MIKSWQPLLWFLVMATIRDGWQHNSLSKMDTKGSFLPIEIDVQWSQYTQEEIRGWCYISHRNTCSKPDGLERRLTCNVQNYAEMTNNLIHHCTEVHAWLHNLVRIWFLARSLSTSHATCHCISGQACFGPFTHLVNKRFSAHCNQYKN